MKAPNIDEIRSAAIRIAPYVHHTPVLSSGAIDQLCQARVFCKCENFQKVGAFKIRGATNAVFSMTEQEVAAGVTTHSSGNHAQALALAAKWRGIPAYVVMPENAPAVKRRAVADYGAEIIPCRPTLAARESTLEKVQARTGAAFIHPYNDYRVIAGQGTAALELCDQAPDLDTVLTPVGGGGLLSGTAITVAALQPTTRILAAEPLGADDAYRSLRAGHIIPSVNPCTIADGLLTSLGDKTFPIIQSHVAAIITVSEEAIRQALRLIWERMKIIVEPSGAVPLAALLTHRDKIPGDRIGLIFTGGNVDLDSLTF